MRARLLRLGGLLLLAVVVSVAGIAISGRLMAGHLLDVGSAAPAVDLLGPGPVHGDAVAAAGAAGHPLAVEFVEVTCPVCRDTAPRLCNSLRTAAGLEVALVDAARESAVAIGAFAQDRLAACVGDARLHVLADPCRETDACGNVSSRWRVDVVPTLYLVDRHGRIAYGATGAGAFDGLDSALRSLGGG